MLASSYLRQAQPPPHTSGHAKHGVATRRQTTLYSPYQYDIYTHRCTITYISFTSSNPLSAVRYPVLLRHRHRGYLAHCNPAEGGITQTHTRNAGMARQLPQGNGLPRQLRCLTVVSGVFFLWIFAHHTSSPNIRYPKAGRLQTNRLLLPRVFLLPPQKDILGGG
jgi:hypothetical protein